jgi:copper chaperone
MQSSSAERGNSFDRTVYPRRCNVDELLMKIEGMSCGHCVGQVTKALTVLDGVQVKAVRVGEAKVTYSPALITPSDIARALTEAGYDVQLVGRAA